MKREFASEKLIALCEQREKFLNDNPDLWNFQLELETELNKVGNVNNRMAVLQRKLREHCELLRDKNSELLDEIRKFIEESKTLPPT